MILQGLSAETLARLTALSRYGDDYSGLLMGPAPEAKNEPEAEAEPPPELRLAAE